MHNHTHTHTVMHHSSQINTIWNIDAWSTCVCVCVRLLRLPFGQHMFFYDLGKEKKKKKKKQKGCLNDCSFCIVRLLYWLGEWDKGIILSNIDLNANWYTTHYCCWYTNLDTIAIDFKCKMVDVVPTCIWCLVHLLYSCLVTCTIVVSFWYRIRDWPIRPFKFLSRLWSIVVIYFSQETFLANLNLLSLKFDNCLIANLQLRMSSITNELHL